MKWNYFINLKAILLVIVVILFLQNVSATIVGLSPASVYFPDVLRGGYAEREITVSVNSEEPATIELSTWGDAQDWINYSEQSFEVSMGSPYRVTVSVIPPDDLPNGNYTGFLRVMTSSLGESIEGHAVGIVRAAQDLAITIEVVDSEIVQCRASKFEVNSVEVGDDVLFEVNILNQGNIRLIPRILIDIWNADQTSIVQQIDFSEQVVLPTREDRFLIRVPSSGFDVSQYWADISILECLAQKLLTFDILEEGALRAKGILLEILAPKNMSLGETVLIAATFKNTGEKTVDAQFIGRITKNGNLVEVWESPVLGVLIDDIEEFTYYFTPQSAGRYVIEGRVYYDGKKTFEKSRVLEVVGTGNGYSYILIIVYVILAALILYLIFKVRKERKKYYRRLKKLK